MKSISITVVQLLRITMVILALLTFAGTMCAAGVQPNFSQKQAIEAPDGSIFQSNTISGTVRDTNGIPIAGAQVIGFGSPGNLVLTQSSANGQYILFVSQDTYHVQASKQGYFAGHVFGVIVPPSHTGIDFALTLMGGTPTPFPQPTSAPGFLLYLPVIVKNLTPPPPTATPTPGPIKFVGTTNQGRPVELDIKPNLSAVTRFRIGYGVTCPNATVNGTAEIGSSTGWSITNRQFEIRIPSSGGNQDIYKGQFDTAFSSAQGTWLKWVSDPLSGHLCSNSGAWSASR